MKILFTLILSFIGCACFAQVDTTSPPYKRFPTLPPVQLVLSDSIARFTKADIPKKKPVLIWLFSPECSHCQHMAEELMQYKKELKDIYIVMATLNPLWMMNEFVEKYKLKEFSNIVVGKDVYYFIPSFYKIHNLPYLAFYDKKGNLIKGFEGSMPMQKIIDVFNQAK